MGIFPQFLNPSLVGEAPPNSVLEAFIAEPEHWEHAEEFVHAGLSSCAELLETPGPDDGPMVVGRDQYREIGRDIGPDVCDLLAVSPAMAASPVPPWQIDIAYLLIVGAIVSSATTFVVSAPYLRGLIMGQIPIGDFALGMGGYGLKIGVGSAAILGTLRALSPRLDLDGQFLWWTSQYSVGPAPQARFKMQAAHELTHLIQLQRFGAAFPRAELRRDLAFFEGHAIANQRAFAMRRRATEPGIFKAHLRYDAGNLAYFYPKACGMFSRPASPAVQSLLAGIKPHRSWDHALGSIAFGIAHENGGDVALGRALREPGGIFSD